MRTCDQFKYLIYIILIIIVLSSCTTTSTNEKNEDIKILLDRGYFDKRLKKANVEWEYDNLTAVKTNNIIFANNDINKKAKEILQNQIKLAKYYKFLQSMNVDEQNLAFPLYNDEQYKEINQLSIAKGFDLAELRKLDARNKELYEEIRSENETLKSDSTLYKIDCTLILNRGEKKTLGNFTFWLTNDKKKLLRVNNNNDKMTKATNNIIANAIKNNY